MNDNLKYCPVPKSQQPLCEYSSLKSAMDFTWTYGDLNGFLRVVTLLFIGLYSIWNIILSNNMQDGFNLKNLLVAINISDLCILLILSRYYLGWYYVYTRLMQATVTYEESGWYDAQTWVKPPSILLQDRLVGTYEVLPVLNRLKQFLVFFVGVIIFGLFIFKFIIK